MDDDKDNDATDPELISSYTRSEALADGVLVDVTETAREAGFVIPIALTRAAWDLCVALSPAAKRACNDERGRCWDLLAMLRWAIGRSRGSGESEIRFEVLCVTRSVHPSRVTLRSVVGPGDDGQPVVTVLLPHESYALHVMPSRRARSRGSSRGRPHPVVGQFEFRGIRCGDPSARQGLSCAPRSMKETIARALIEIGFIIFLFYANLLMGEYEHSAMGRTRGLAWAVSDILTASNFVIAMVSAIIGYVVFEFLRKKLP